jgi:pimeloyl-ACP methyl ester carboxylesterase
MIEEALSFVEFGRLLIDPLFRGVDVPRGDGRLVVVIPGLFGNDLYLDPIRGWLRRIGYTPLRSTLTVNAGCPRRLRDQIQAEILRHLDRAPGPIAIIGHSRGGVIAWTIAAQMREQVSHLALLGSPIGAYRHAIQSGDDLSSPTPMGRILGRASTFARRMLDPDCTVPACACAFVEDVMSPISPQTALMAIASRDDEVVASELAQVGAGEVIEVGGSHSGLVVNREVYRALAQFLSLERT